MTIWIKSPRVIRNRKLLRSRLQRLRIRAKLEALMNLKIQEDSDNIIPHVINMNKKMQYLIWMGSRYVCKEENKYEILRESFVKLEHKEHLRWVWEHNCLDKMYRTLVVNFITSWLNYTLNYHRLTPHRRCIQVDTRAPEKLVKSIPKLVRVYRIEVSRGRN